MPRSLLSLVTWNVHGWVGIDGRRDPVRSFDAIRGFDADIVVLQEMEGSDWPALAEAAGYEVVIGATKTPDFGNALLTRVPLEEVSRVDLSVSGREARGALDALVSVGGRRVRVVSTHLGLRASERRRQATRLAGHIDDTASEMPLVLAGDLNDWTPWGAQLRPLVRMLGPLSRLPTFPSRRPVFALDRVACRAPGFGCLVTTISDIGARRASDHLPLGVTLEEGPARLPDEAGRGAGPVGAGAELPGGSGA